jgi:hypothetical protein
MATQITHAGNTLAPALAILRKLGFAVTWPAPGSGSDFIRAEKGDLVLYAEDPVTLLGLLRVYEERGPNWHPTDAEVQSLLDLEDPT